MQVEGKEKFQRIFGENSEKALDIFLVSGIKVGHIFSLSISFNIAVGPFYRPWITKKFRL